MNSKLEDLIEDTIQYLSHTLVLDAEGVKKISGIVRVSIKKSAGIDCGLYDIVERILPILRFNDEGNLQLDESGRHPILRDELPLMRCIWLTGSGAEELKELRSKMGITRRPSADNTELDELIEEWESISGGLMEKVVEVVKQLRRERDALAKGIGDSDA